MQTEKRLRREGNEDAAEALRRAQRKWGGVVADLPRRAGADWWVFRVRSAG